MSLDADWSSEDSDFSVLEKALYDSANGMVGSVGESTTNQFSVTGEPYFSLGIVRTN